MIVIYWKYMNTSLRTPFLLLGTVAILVLLLPVLTALAQQTESEANLDASASASSSLQTKVDAGNALNSISDAVVTDSADTDEYGDSYNEMPPRDIDKPSLTPGEDGYIPNIREGGQTVEAGNVPETQQQQNDDNDGDGWADEAITATGDLTPIYPPRPRGGILVTDNDSDAAAIKGTSKTTVWSVEEGAASMAGGGAGKVTFKSRLREAGLSEGAATEFLAKLDRIKIDVILDEEINEVDGSTSQWSLHNITISADDLKDWTDTDRKSYQALKQAFKKESPEYASLLLVEHMLEDDRVESIISNETSLNIQYRAKIKLFGIIPLEDTVVATLQLPGVDDVVWDMRIAVDWPWYARFLSTKESADTIDETVLSVAKKAKFKAGKALAETVK